MLSGLFKPAWQNASAEKRLQAIEKLDASDNDSLAVLENLAKEDSELNVRRAAIGRLPATSLFPLLSNHPDEPSREQAIIAFSALIGSKSALTEEEARSLIKAHADAKIWLAKLCPISELRAELLADLSEPELAEIIADIEYAETRKLIAEKLSSAEHLELARKALKGKDKNSEKIIKSKIDAIRAEQKRTQENRETAEDLCTKMEYLASAVSEEWRAEFKRRYLACETQWDSLDFDPDEDLKKRYESAFDPVAEEAARQEQIDAAYSSQETLAEDLEAFCHEIASYPHPQVLEKLDSLSQKHTQAKAEWERLAETVRANLNVADKFFLAEGALASFIHFIHAGAIHTETEKLDGSAEAADSQNLATTLKRALSELRWPKPYPPLESESLIRAKLTELQGAARSEQKAHKEKLDKLHKRINRILGSTQRGEIGRAKRELEAVTKAAEKFSGKDKAGLQDRIEKAAESVSKMGDWKDFATEPKYAELCEAMEALQDSKAHPDKLAEEIKTLQTKWKALGYSDSSEKYWERFKESGDKAYEPCAQFFQERRDTRKQNLESREPLIEKTKAILDDTEWDGQPDYKAIEISLRHISDDWKKIKDVEQRPGQKQWNRFCKLKDAIYDKLSLVYDANIALKEQLIEQAIELGETDVNEQSLTRLQQLQARWKQVGVTRRKDDQAAWKKFKSATDSVYEKIQGVRQVKRDEENQQLDGYRTIIRQIQDLAKNAKDLAEADHSFERLQSEYQTLPPLPKALPEKLLEGLSKDYQRACDLYAKSRDRILAAAGKEELNALREKARLCGALERLASEEGKETEIENLQSDIDGIEIHDRALKKRFEQRLSAAFEPDKSEATERRRSLCIDLEILLGKESPAEDKALRMQVQFERMKTQGLGQAPTNKSSVIEEFKIDWLCLPGASPDAQASLDERFQILIS